jgi:hypothetical protein
LIGLKAHFTQLMMSKGADYKGKNDPTCLIVGTNGSVSGGKIYQMPGSAKGGGKPVSGKPTGKMAAPAPPAATSKSKPNGKVPDTDAGDEVETTALECLAAIQESSAGQTMTRQKIGAKLVTVFAKKRVPAQMHKPIQEMVKNDEWFMEKAAELEWGIDGVEVTIPA